MHLLKPGHMYYRFPRWVRKIDYMIPTHLLNPLLVPLHRYLYTRAYGLALKKWPHLRQEILGGADHNELLHKYGVHVIRDSSNGYSIHYDWHPDNYSVRYKDLLEERELEYKLIHKENKDPITIVKRDCSND